MKKYLISLFITHFFSITCIAQEFSFECFHPKGFTPFVYYYDVDKNIYEKFIQANKISLKKKSDTSSLLLLHPITTAFSELQTDVVLVYPGAKSVGHLDNVNFKLRIIDTTGPNFLLSQYSSGIANIILKYNVETPYIEFKNCFLSLKNYVDSCTKVLSKLKRTEFNPLVIAAIKEYLMMRLAHFSVLPILFKNQYDKMELKKYIDENISVSDPRLWLQTQAGHIFLKTYYTQIALPESRFNLKKSVSSKFFLDFKIRKYVSYYYFDECLSNKEQSHNKEELWFDFIKFKASEKFTEAEKEELNDLQTRIQQMGTDISKLFCSQDIETLSGRRLTFDEKRTLINGTNIILDYWASWCVPCRTKMNQLKNDTINVAKKKYKIIFLSIDENEDAWVKAKYPFSNDKNWFRVVDYEKNAFVNKYKVVAIPRYFLVSKYLLVSDHFEY